MAPRRWILLIMTATLMAALAGCNSGSTANVQNPPPPPPNGVSIAFQPAPPSSLAVNSSTPVTAVVSNDSSNAGVDWVLTCQTGGATCGTLVPPHTASGSPATYTPPSSLAGNTQIVNIEGFATADHSKNVLASINVTAFGSNLSGTYVFAAQGLQNSTTYQIAGVIFLDGNGNITSGQQTVDYSDPATGYTSVTLPISTSGSSYFLGPDGRGTLTITPNNSSNTGTPIGTENFSLVYLSSSQLLITEVPNASLNVSASGTMDLQAATVTTALTGGYAFVVSGTDFSSGSQLGIGGIFNIDNVVNNPKNISGKGSVADQNFAGTLTANQTLNGNVTIPGSLGVLTLTLNFPNFFNGTPTETFTGYVIDQNHIQLIESDIGGFGSVAGLALGQGSSTGTFTDSAFSGTYIFAALGEDLANGSPAFPNTLTSVVSFTADGAGHLLNGYTDTVLEIRADPTTGLPGSQISGTFTGNFSAAATGSGRVSSSFGTFAAPNNLFRPIVIFYLGGDGTALVLLNSDTSLNYPMVASGIAYPQSTTLTFSGNYGLNFTQQTGTTEYDGTAIMTVASSSITGFADVGPNAPGQGFTGTVTTQPCSIVTVGCFSGSLSNNTGFAAFVGTNASNPNAPVAFTADFYMIDQTRGYFVENDITQQQSGPQVSLGYFATATAPQTGSAVSHSGKRRKPAR